MITFRNDNAFREWQCPFGNDNALIYPDIQHGNGNLYAIGPCWAIISLIQLGISISNIQYEYIEHKEFRVPKVLNMIALDNFF